MCGQLKVKKSEHKVVKNTKNSIIRDLKSGLKSNWSLKLIFIMVLPAVIVMWQPVKKYVYAYSYACSDSYTCSEIKNDETGISSRDVNVMNDLMQIQDNDLYALSACLMDADSGRILYEKNGYDERAMASTTKIMTLIVALENISDDVIVIVSDKAATQPKVRLGMNSGDEFYIRDLYYSLMLESHNDTAVAIAEAVSGSTEEFAKLMNKKAKDIGANNTYFITPNGLDAKDDNGIHHTTATDLAKIMSYCINYSPCSERFVEITQTADYTFTDISGAKNYSVYNHNAFLNMMDGVISGKTGYTSEAGYCYVCALLNDGRRYVVSLLGCGWPSNKSYKWSDTRKLMEYGINNFKKTDIYSETVIDGIDIYSGNSLTGFSHVDFYVEQDSDNRIELLMSDRDFFEKRINMQKDIMLPVTKGEIVGNVEYYLNDENVAKYSICISNSAKKTTLKTILQIVTRLYFCS